jgi:DNA-binding NarL/FixJ family response regulator
MIRQALGGRRVRVLIGETQSALVELLSRCVEAAAAPRVRASVVALPPHAEEILRSCEDSPFDLVILILNNIVFPEIMVGTRQTRRKRWLRFISEVKSRSRCRMIVFSGWRDDDPVLDGLHVTDAIAAGADVFFPMPAPTSQIIGAINKCLSGRDDAANSGAVPPTDCRR